MRTDNELIALSSVGDEQALGELVRRHVDFVYRIALRTTENRDDAEDATQQAFVNAWKAIQMFQSGANFRAWIGRIVRNTAIDVMRKRREVPFSAYEGTGYETEQFVVVDDSPSPEARAMERESHTYAHTLLGALSTDDQEIVLLHVSDGLTFREIGDILDTPLHTIKSRYRRALQRLKEEAESSDAPKPNP